MSEHPYRVVMPPEPRPMARRSRGDLGRAMAVVQVALLTLCVARLWIAATTGVIDFEGILALALFVALCVRAVRTLLGRL
jgi:hypothetical protein